MPDTRFSVRLATSADREAIIRLISEMHGGDMTDRFDRLYRSNPHGDAVSWVAVDDESGHVAAVTSVFPREVMTNGRARRGAIGGDSYVEPSARRQGLATRLHRAIRDDMRTAGVEFHFGVPLQNNLRALVKAGGIEVTSFARYVRPLTGEFLGEQIVAHLPGAALRFIPRAVTRTLGRCALGAMEMTRSRRPAGYAAEKAGHFDAEWDAWVQEQVCPDGVHCVRDSAYMNFRYGRSEGDRETVYLVRHEGALTGMFVIQQSLDGRSAFMGDFFTSFELRSLRAILALATQQAIDLGCGDLRTKATPLPVLVKALRAEGFLERGGPDAGVFHVASSAEENESDVLEDPHAWYFLARDQDM